MLPCSFSALPGANPILYFFQVSKLPVGPLDPGLTCFAAASGLCQVQIFPNLDPGLKCFPAASVQILPDPLFPRQAQIFPVRPSETSASIRFRNYLLATVNRSLKCFPATSPTKHFPSLQLQPFARCKSPTICKTLASMGSETACGQA